MRIKLTQYHIEPNAKPRKIGYKNTSSMDYLKKISLNNFSTVMMVWFVIPELNKRTIEI